MPLSHFDVGIVAVPDERVERITFLLADQLMQHTRLLSCVSRNRVPHITLFQGRFPLTSLEEICTMPMQANLFCLMQNTIEVRANGNIIWKVVPEAKLQRAHNDLHEQMHPRSEGLMRRFQQMADDESLSKEERAHIRAYGSVLAGPHYEPHITLACCANLESGQRAAAHVRPPPNVTFHVHRLCLALLHEDGSVDKLLLKR